MHSDVDFLKEKIKRLEEENHTLREDAAFRPIFDHSPLGIFRTTLEGKFLRANQTLCEILGYDHPDDLISSVNNISMDIYAKEEDRQMVMNQLKNGKNYIRFEIDFKRKNGEVFPGFVSAKLIKDDNGNAKYIEGTAEDISEFKQAEIEKKKSDNLYKTLINTISDSIVISDISGMIEFASPSVAEITASNSTDTILNTNILDWIDERYHHKAKENLHKIINNLPYNYEEYEMKREDGTTFFAEIRTTVLNSENGKPFKLISLIQDISKRKKTEEILRQTQDLYRTIIELSPAGILIVFKGKILFLNSASAKIFDSTNQWDLIGKDLGELIAKDHEKDLLKTLRKIESGEIESRSVQIQLISTIRQIKDAQVLASPIFYDGKNCTFLFVSDITERINAEKELKREKQLMDTFWDHVPDSITFKNLEGKYIKVNREFLRWIGVKHPDQVIGKKVKDIFGPEHFKIAQKEDKDVIEYGQPIMNELREEIWPKNVKKWVMLTKMPLFDINQNIVGVFCMTRDITKEKKAEFEIRNREQWFRHIFDQSPIGKVIINQKYGITRFNNSTLTLTGLTEDYLGKKSIFTLFDKEDHKILSEKLASINSVKEKSFSVELRLKTHKNEYRSVIVQGVNLKDSGRPYGDFLIHFIDIHKRKLAEDLLLVRNTELNNFVYKVSHDLRAPLTSIKGLINLINLEKDPSVFHEYLQMISGRVERLDSFIRDVLSHSKNLNLKISIEKVDLKEIIDDCLNRVAYHSSLKITPSVSVKGKDFYSDYQRVHEILRNLISNAYQYSKKNKKNSQIKIITKTTQKYSRIIVEDNGIGIKKKFQPKIFDMFYRANEKVEGSGLGLYIVKLSVENLKGEIKFTSAYNKGTQFEIILPNHIPG